MSICAARKRPAHRRIFSGLAGLVLMTLPVLMARPMPAAADPYNSPNDVAAYQSAQYGQPMPPPPQYYGPPGSYAHRNQLLSQLNYAESQYNRARQSGNREAAKYWRKDIKHLKRELSAQGHAENPGYGVPTYMAPPQSAYAQPMQAYGPPMQQYGSPSGPAYAEPYPPTTPYGYGGNPAPYASAPYPATQYPSAAYPNTAAASPYGTPGASGSTGGLGSLLGPLFGAGSAPSAAGYTNAGAASPNGAPASTGSMGDIVNSLMGSMRGSVP